MNDSRNQRQIARRGHSFSTILVTLTSIGVGVGLITGVGMSIYNNIAISDARTENSQAAQQDLFWQTFTGEKSGEGLSNSSRDLATSVKDVLTLEATALEKGEEAPSSLLVPSSLESVFVAPGLFEGTEEALGLNVFKGILDDGSEVSYVCEECGKFEESFNAQARLLFNTGDYTPTASNVAVGSEPWWPLPWTMGYGYLGGMLLGWLFAVGGTNRDGYGTKNPALDLSFRYGSRNDKLRAWISAWPLMFVWKIGNSSKKARLEAQEKKVQKDLEAKKREAEEKEMSENPVAFELIRARENVKRLQALPQVPEVVDSLKFAKKVVLELEGMPAKFDASSAAMIARSIQAENEDILLRTDGLARGRKEMQA